MRSAVIQIDPHLGDTAYNLALVEEKLEDVSAKGVHLAIFPECALSGYVFTSLQEAREVAEPLPGPSSDRIAAAASRHGVYTVVGMLERDGERVYNAALLAGPEGLISVYRKTHTLCLGVDRFTTPGENAYKVHDLPIGKLGILICYDLRFPEPARALSLAGAELIAVPTNWPETSHIQPDVFTRARAAENHVFVLAANRVGEERGTRFLGRSQIVSSMGNVREEAGEHEPEILVRDLDPLEADRKNVVVRPGEHEMDCFADRRPDLYHSLLRDTLAAEVR